MAFKTIEHRQTRSSNSQIQNAQNNDRLPLLRSRSPFPATLTRVFTFKLQAWNASCRSRAKEFEQPRKEWSKLNRLRSPTGYQNDMLRSQITHRVLVVIKRNQLHILRKIADIENTTWNQFLKWYQKTMH